MTLDDREGPRVGLGVSFERQCQWIRPKLYIRAMRLTRDRADAEDLVQATLIKAWLHYGSFCQDRPFINWIASIMLRTLLDRRRQERRRVQAVSLDALSQFESDDPLEFIATVPSAESEAALIERLSCEELVKAVRSLPEAHRRVICLHELHGLSYEECAEIEGVAVGTIRSRLFRARERLRAILTSNTENAPDLFS